MRRLLALALLLALPSVANAQPELSGGGGAGGSLTTITTTIPSITITNPTTTPALSTTPYVDDGNCGASKTIDFSSAAVTPGVRRKVTLSAATCAITLVVPNGCIGCALRIYQNAGSQVVTYVTTVRWAGGSAPTLTTTAGKYDVMAFDSDGTDIGGGWELNH